MNKPDDDFYYSDGRINPDKAFNFVIERTRTMESEEFVRLMSKALEVQPEESDLPTSYSQPDESVSKANKARTRGRTTPTVFSPGATKRPSRAKKKADL